VLRRAIDKWLKAGVLDEGQLQRPKQGTPQGGVISPILANIYLHEVLDEWFMREVVPRLRGRAVLIRYADDAVVLFSSEDDARRVLEVLPKRLGRYGLCLHPEKTRLVPFDRPRSRPSAVPTDRPGTFDFLGFTHYWGKSRGGRWVVQRKTAKDRRRRTLRMLNDWLKGHRHLPIAVQQAQLSLKLRGHYAYYGITGNARCLDRIHYRTQRLWRKWLGRRSQRGLLSWERFRRLLARHPLPRPTIVHSVYRHAANRGT
jgi:hypothetical protein